MPYTFADFWAQVDPEIRHTEAGWIEARRRYAGAMGATVKSISRPRWVIQYEDGTRQRCDSERVFYRLGEEYTEYNGERAKLLTRREAGFELCRDHGDKHSVSCDECAGWFMVFPWEPLENERQPGIEIA